MNHHHGQIIERVIRRNGHSISELARLANVNRRSVYNWFNQKSLKPEIIFRIGCVINYDFSVDFPDLFSKDDFIKQSIPFTAIATTGTDLVDADYWKNKYIDLLERYNRMLLMVVDQKA